MKVGEFVKITGIPAEGLEILNGHIAQIITTFGNGPSGDIEVTLPNQWPDNDALADFCQPDNHIHIMIFHNEYEPASGPQYWFYEQEATV